MHDAGIEHQDVMVQLLRLANSARSLRDLMRETTTLLRIWTGCEAVGIRLRDGEDFPYFEASGFPLSFLTIENSLCTRDLNGQLKRDLTGNAVLECMCGNVICGRYDPKLPFFTPNGSFWTNSTSQLLASTTEADRQARTRNRCNGEGYESVALIPLRSSGMGIGLMQINDRHPNRFTPQLIGRLEELAEAVAQAVTRQDFEGRLRSSQNNLHGLFNAILENAPIMMCVLDHHCDVLHFNRVMQTFLGLRLDEVRDRGVGGIFRCVNSRKEERGCGFSRQCHLCPVRMAMVDTLETGKSHQGVEYRMSVERAGGVEERVMLAATAMIRVNDKPNLLLCLDDITDRELAEASRRRAEERFRRLVDTMNEGVICTDAEGHAIFVNEQMAAMLGYSVDEMMGRALGDWMFEEDRGSQPADSEVTGRECRLRRKDGGECWTLMSIVRDQDEQGNTIGSFAIVIDITLSRERSIRLASVERQLAHASRLAAMGELAAGIAHEVNQPLCAIVNFAKACENVLSRENPDLDKVRHWCEAMVTAAARGGEFVKNLCRFTRQSTVHSTSTTIQQLVDDASTLVRYEVLSRKVSLVKELPAEPIVVTTDPIQMQHVLVNLLQNALESFPSAFVGRKEVSVRAILQDDRVELLIRDNGQGIPHTNLGLIFEPFFTTKQEGLGLGLPISRTTVEAQGGQLWVTPNPDCGVTLHVQLPLARGSTA